MLDKIYEIMFVLFGIIWVNLGFGLMIFVAFIMFTFQFAMMPIIYGISCGLLTIGIIEILYFDYLELKEIRKIIKA